MRHRGIKTGGPPVASAVAAPAEQHEAFFEEFTLHENSLDGAVHVDASCDNVWKILTQLDLLQKLAPHLHLTTDGGQKTAEKRGDVVNYSIDKPAGPATGQFILASPVPFIEDLPGEDEARLQVIHALAAGTTSNLRRSVWRAVPSGQRGPVPRSPRCR